MLSTKQITATFMFSYIFYSSGNFLKENCFAIMFFCLTAKIANYYMTQMLTRQYSHCETVQQNLQS